jgi:electron transfer flavoprotein alpha subunit
VSAVLAVCEQRDGVLRKASHEVVTGARRLADALGGGTAVEAVVLGAGKIRGTEELGRFGADRVSILTNAVFERYAPEGWARALADRVRAASPIAVVFVASATGRDLAPRVAARLASTMAADVTDLEVTGGALIATRPVYAGKALLKVRLTARPALLSIRPNVFTPVERRHAGTESVEAVDVPAGRVKVTELKAADAGRVDVGEATIVISGGRGLKDPANFKILEDLAAAFGGRAAVGASRAVVDAGWRAHADQVGQTGKTVSPSLYFAVGISGAIQHLAGMRTSKVIVAINRDKDAPIFKIADYGVVGDLFEIVPRLAEEIRKING